MANEKQLCPIWRTPVKQIIRYQEGDHVSAVQGAPRTDGDYEITALAINHVGAMDESERARLTTRIIEERRKTVRGPRSLVHGISDFLTSVCATAPCTARASGS